MKSIISQFFVRPVIFMTLFMGVVFPESGSKVTALGNHRLFLPDSLENKTPLVLVEDGLAQRFADLGTTLPQKVDAAVLELNSLRGAGPEAYHAIVGQALAKLSDHSEFRSLATAPRIAIGFSAMGPTTLKACIDNPQAYSGLVLVNSAAAVSSLPAKPSDMQKSLPFLVIHGDKDPVSPLTVAKNLTAKADKIGLNVTMHTVASKDHFGPFALAQKQLMAFIVASQTSPEDIAVSHQVAFQKVAPGKKTSHDFETISTNMGDLSIYADHYKGEGDNRPLLILFHMAGGSRGEYRRLASILVAAGFDCLAVDQRVGKGGRQFAGVVNRTAAQLKQTSNNFMDAVPDIKRALAWGSELGYNSIGAIGSSYSAALLIGVAAARGDQSMPIAALSPGEYFKKKNTVRSAAKGLKSDIFIAYPQREKRQVAPILKAIPQQFLTEIPGTQGHGSMVLGNDPRAEPLSALIAFFNQRLKE